jgi:hypothetical protein
MGCIYSLMKRSCGCRSKLAVGRRHFIVITPLGVHTFGNCPVMEFRVYHDATMDWNSVPHGGCSVANSQLAGPASSAQKAGRTACL